MRKKILSGIIVLMVGLFVFVPVNAQTESLTPTPSETVLATTPTITITANPTATTSATPTKITSLPKTGFVKYSAFILLFGIGVVVFSLVF